VYEGHQCETPDARRAPLLQLPNQLLPSPQPLPPDTVISDPLITVVAQRMRVRQRPGHKLVLNSYLGHRVERRQIQLRADMAGVLTRTGSCRRA
jgi:hypothetical protein